MAHTNLYEGFFRLTALILFFLVSCSSEDDPADSTPKPENCIFTGQNNSDLQYTIVRNDKGLPVSLNFFYKSNSFSTMSAIEYDEADNIMKMSQDNGYFLYEYDAGGRPISRQRFGRTDPSAPFTQFEKYSSVIMRKV